MCKHVWLPGLLALACLSGGCVERRYVITSEPSAAQVFVNGQPIGFTPVDGTFLYHGKYDITLVKDGYETLHATQDIPARWYQYPPLDFVSENLYPGKIRDVRRFHFTLQPRRQVGPEEVIPRAEQLRQQGRLIGVPSTAPPPPLRAPRSLPAPTGTVPASTQTAPNGERQPGAP